ncbi:MAG: excalibur calcium-binding domain-containing protein [Solirubrobacterales bacterium]
MEKLVVTGLAIALAVLAIAALPGQAAAGDKDCSDFATQRAAQISFLKHGGPRHDPDRLDADHDGIACEDNPCPCYRKRHLPRRAKREALSVERLRL